jgi:competence protein ComEC
MIAVCASLVTTLIASFATAPFAAYHFQRMNPYGLIGNALAIPFVSFVVMPAAVGGTLLMPFGLDGPIWQAMGLGSDKVLVVANFVALIDGSVRGVRAFPLTYLIWMAAGFIVLVLVRSPLRLVGLAAMILASVAAAGVRPPDVFVDRQGQVAAVRSEDGRLQILGRSASRFTVDRWLSADGDLRKGNDPALKRLVACDRLGCTAPLADGAAVALVLQPEAFEEDCRRAKLVITPLAAPAFCTETTQVIDRSRLGFAASLALYREPSGFVEVPARSRDGWKPWFGRPEQPVAASRATQVQPPPNPAPPDRDPASDSNDDGADMILP